MSKDDSWLIEFASFLKEKWIVQKPNLIFWGVGNWIDLWCLYMDFFKLEIAIGSRARCTDGYTINEFVVNGVNCFLCNSRCSSSRRWNRQCQFGTVWGDDTSVATSFRWNSESSISFCLLVWNCRQNGVKILTWLGWFFNVPVYAFLMFGITSRVRDWWMHAVNIGFYPLGKTTSVHYSLSTILSLFSVVTLLELLLLNLFVNEWILVWQWIMILKIVCV